MKFIPTKTENKMETIYDVDFFIRKFRDIPDSLWFVGDLYSAFGGQKCAVGHCKFGQERDAFWRLFPDVEYIEKFPESIKSIAPDINDGLDPRYTQPTPKQRILAALYDIKAAQHPTPKATEVVERVVYVAFDASVRELQKQLNEN